MRRPRTSLRRSLRPRCRRARRASRERWRSLPASCVPTLATYTSRWIVKPSKRSGSNAAARRACIRSRACSVAGASRHYRPDARARALDRTRKGRAVAAISRCSNASALARAQRTVQPARSARSPLRARTARRTADRKLRAVPRSPVVSTPPVQHAPAPTTPSAGAQTALTTITSTRAARILLADPAADASPSSTRPELPEWPSQWDQLPEARDGALARARARGA